MSDAKSAEPSPLFQQIRAALSEHPEADGVRLSIESEGRKRTGATGRSYSTKSLCWNLTRSGDYATDPVLVVVHAHHSEEGMRRDLALEFPGLEVVVDNEIYIGDEPS